MHLLHPAIAPWLQAQDNGYRVRLLCSREHGLCIFLRVVSDKTELCLPMRRVAYEGTYAVFEAILPEDAESAFTTYLFQVMHEGRQIWLAADGSYAEMPPGEVYFKLCQENSRRQKKWLQEQIFYQFNSAPFYTNDDHPLSQRDESSAANDYALQLQEKLNYLQQTVGISALYFAPSAASFSQAGKPCNKPESALKLNKHFAGAVTRSGLMQYQQDGSVELADRFARTLRAWLYGGLDASQPIDGPALDRSLMQCRAQLSYANQLVQIHRLLACENLTSDLGIARTRLALVLLMTYPGVPCLCSHDDADFFSDQGQAPSHEYVELLAYYQTMIALRQNREELRSGAYLTLIAQGDVFVFARYTERQITLVALNRANLAQTPCLDLSLLPVIAHGWHRADMDSSIDNAYVQFPPSRLEPNAAQIWVSRMQP